MKILITGGYGFVGNFLFSTLKEKYDVYRFSSKEINLKNSIDTNKLFDTNFYDCVIHCALTGREELFSEDPTFLSDGLLMFKNLWNNKNKFTKFINLGTAYEQDLTVNNNLIKENDFLYHLPSTSYGFSKNIIARIIKDTENFYNLRIFGNFHETESSKRFFKKVIYENQLTIKDDIYIDYIYMPDLIPVIESIVNNEIHETAINMVYQRKYKLSEMAFMLCDLLNINKSKIQIINHSGNNLTGDGTILSKYNFNFIGLEQGLRNYK